MDKNEIEQILEKSDFDPSEDFKNVPEDVPQELTDEEHAMFLKDEAYNEGIEQAEIKETIELAEAVKENIEKTEETKSPYTFSNVSPFKYKVATERDLQDIINKVKFPLALPSGKVFDRLATLEYIRANKNRLDTFLSNFSIEQRIILSGSDEAVKFMSKEYMTEIQNDNKYHNNCNYGPTPIDINAKYTPPIKEGDTVSNVSRFLAMVGVGNHVDIPLYHSGFRIVCRPPTQGELAKLELAVYNADLSLGRETSGFITSSKRAFSTELISGFITDCMVSTTLNFPADRDHILSYVSILDLNTILLSLIAASNPNKIDMQRMCSNSLVFEDDKVICGEVAVGTVDPSKLLFVNRKVFDNDMLAILSRRLEASVSVEDVKFYKQRLSENSVKYNTYENAVVNGYKDIEVNGANNTVRVNFTIPSIYEYVKHGSLWIETVKADVEDILASNDAVDKDDAISKIINSYIGSNLISNIKSLEINGVNGRETVEDKTIIMELMNKLIYGTDKLDSINEAIHGFTILNNNAIVAIPNYVCPKCQQKQEADVNSEFESLIPLDMMDFFFKLIQHQNSMMGYINTL